MIETLRTLVLRSLRVPAEPTPPAGPAGTVRVFRASPRYFRYRLLGWALRQLLTLAGVIAGTLLLGQVGGRLGGGLMGRGLMALELLAWAGYLAQLPYTLMALRLDYEMRWYMLSDRALRIREGVFSVRERTMTFANIQQIGVRQGPLQRILGIADVEVRTAGGGATEGSGDSGGDLHRGYFRGVEEAESIRDTIRDRVRDRRGDGVAGEATGEVESPGPLPAGGARGPGAEGLQAARELLQEVRILRRVVG